jgi:diacylglycerol kinase family enzyme
MIANKPVFERCVVVVNPTSTNYNRGQHEIRQLAGLFAAGNLDIIEISSNDYSRPSWLITRLNAAVDKKTLLAVAGGDGTLNLIVDTILRSSEVSAAVRQAVILPLWAGNANDLAHMANGNPPASMESLLDRAVVATVYPLAVNTRHRAKTATRLAVCYVSIGASAYVSARINNPSYRRKRLYRLPGGRNLTDMATVTRAFIWAATFESIIDGQRRRIYDIVMVNGSRMAKVSRIPVKLTDKNFYEMLVVRKHPLILSSLVQIIRGILIERRTHTERVLTVNETTWAQVDGEALRIPGHTDVVVRHYDKPFYLLSTKLT